MDHISNNIKNVNKSEEQNIGNTFNYNKITKNINKGEKRKMDCIQNVSNKKRKFIDKKYKCNREPSALESITDDRLKAYGINPKKFRNKLKFGNK